MESKLLEVIESLAEEAKKGISPDASLKFTQSALNLAHVLATLGANKREDKRNS